MSLKGKLNRFKKHIVVEQSDKSNVRQNKVMVDEVPSIQIPFREEWDRFSTTPFYFDQSYSLVREVSYPINFKHGLYSFAELEETVQLWKENRLKHPFSSHDHRANDMIFFDTETTGLGGGVGNTIFLIGYARVFEDRVMVKQHFLPSPGSEVPLYQGFLSDLDNIDQMKLTSYNGKAFDWPQIKTRHTLIREQVPKLPSFGHYDLLHASRRMWKNQLPSVKLSVVEQEMLNINRDGDVPGFLAPMLYFDFIKDPNPQGIQGVFTHNEVDVLTLITLYIHLSKKLLGSELDMISANEKYEVARWYEQVGEVEVAFKYYQDASKGSDQYSIASKKAIALLLKKQKRFEEAIKMWEHILEIDNNDFIVRVELSKAYEHRIKDPEKAYYYAMKALHIWKKNSPDDLVPSEFHKRIERLKKKIN